MDSDMSRTLTMAKPPHKRVQKKPKRFLHYNKNALKLHARNCTKPEWCTYGQEFGWDARQINDEAVLVYHNQNCHVGGGSGSHGMRECGCWERLQEHHCKGAVNAENAAAEIERHLAAIRKIKRTGKPLKGKERYTVYPE
jgi:hypothetical protein